MSATAGIVGKGTTIGYSAYPTPSTYTLFAEVTGEIPFPMIQTDGDVDFTNFTSPNSHVETKASGWIKTDPIDIECTYTQTQHAALVALVGTDKTIQITTPDTHTATFPAYLQKIGGTIPNKDKITTKLTLLVKGITTFA